MRLMRMISRVSRSVWDGGWDVVVEMMLRSRWHFDVNYMREWMVPPHCSGSWPRESEV
jgi:hypothetical protein